MAKLTKLATSLLEKRYLIRDKDDRLVETFPTQLWRRVAKHIAKVEPEPYRLEWENKFYSLMESGAFLPNSPTLFNAGRDCSLSMLSACFVVDVPDTMQGILDANSTAAMIQKHGGGVGFDFSQLRPRGSRVKTTNGVASGPVSFMQAIHSFCQTIKQGGMRRGANIGILRIDHPDIEEFVQCKKNGDLEAFNISVSVTDEFMQHLFSHKEMFDLKFGDKVYKSVKTADLWNLICSTSHGCGDPGILYIDTVNATNPTPNLGRIEACNPCGEQFLLPNESCCLGSINLTKFVNKSTRSFDFSRLLASNTVSTCIRFLDNVISINEYPTDAIRTSTLRNRKIGLGVMGFADVLYMLEIPYDSPEARKLGSEIMRIVSNLAHTTSASLGESRGSFDGFGQSEWYHEFANMRNAACTTVAPTGTLSLLTNCSSGIEPNYALIYNRKIDNEYVRMVNPVFEQYAKKNRCWGIENFFDKLLETGGSIQNMDGVPDRIKKVFKTAHDIDPSAHVLMQSAFQKYVDNSISKTINLVHDATVADVSSAYMLAYKMGCKGITVFRDGCKGTQILTSGRSQNVSKPHSSTNANSLTSVKISPRKRVQTVQGTTTKFRVACGTLYITVNKDNDGICEVFTILGKAGGCPAQSEAISRIVSLSLRAGVSVIDVIEQLRGIRCLSCKGKQLKVLSCPDAIGRALEHFENNNNGFDNTINDSGHNTNNISNISDNVLQQVPDICPLCGRPIVSEGGCRVCLECGWSKCS